MKKNIVDLNEDLDYDVYHVYFNRGLNLCAHSKIALDSRDHLYKCIGCFTIFDFQSLEQIETFKHKIIDNFNFPKAEAELKRKIKKAKLGEDEDEEE